MQQESFIGNVCVPTDGLVVPAKKHGLIIDCVKRSVFLRSSFIFLNTILLLRLWRIRKVLFTVTNTPNSFLRLYTRGWLLVCNMHQKKTIACFITTYTINWRVLKNSCSIIIMCNSMVWERHICLTTTNLGSWILTIPYLHLISTMKLTRRYWKKWRKKRIRLLRMHSKKWKRWKKSCS